MHHLYNNIWQDKDGSFILKGVDGSWFRVGSVGLSFRDKYGNVTIMDGEYIKSSTHIPTYAELYEYWLKTKQND